MSEAIFSVLTAKLLRSHHRDRRRLRDTVADSIRSDADPSARLGEFLSACVGENGGMDGLDIATDVVTLVGAPVMAYALEFWSRDNPRFDRIPTHEEYHQHDDIWYALVRGIAASPDVPTRSKLTLADMLRCQGTASMREAVVHALAEIGNERATERLKALARDRDGSVRESARKALGDFGI